VTTATEVTIEVATVDFRRALTAVVPHAEKNKTGDNGVMHRFRLCIDASEVYLLATNGQTTGLAAVPIQSDDRSVRFEPDDGPFWVDLLPRHSALILQHFPISTGSGSDMDEMLELKATTKEFRVQDVGGLWAGDSVLFKQADPTTDYPDLIGPLSRALAERGSTPAPKPLVASAQLLKLFQGAGDAYGEPIELYSTGTNSSRGFVVACGTQFVGTVESRHQDDDGMRRRDAAHMRWLERFPAATLTAVSG
jgi:hypothetical protein